MKPRIGVLALQGAYGLHKEHLEEAGCSYSEVRHSQGLECIDGLILPGGESTAMLNQLKACGMWGSLADYVKKRPTWAICAGVILLAKRVENPNQESLEALGVKVSRNSYGRHQESFEESINGTKVSYIRAPIIDSLEPDIRVHHFTGGNPTWVESRNVMATTFHPELSRATPSPFHKYFVSKVGDSINEIHSTSRKLKLTPINV